MTLATLILDSLVSGLFLIALGGLLDVLHARHRRLQARPRASDPFAALERWSVTTAPHLGRLSATGHEPSAWPR
jgi:hypothetical protein